MNNPNSLAHGDDTLQGIRHAISCLAKDEPGALARNDDSYFRSRAFTSRFGPNPLIASASPLFSLISRVQSSQALPEPKRLHDNILHELRAFDTQLREHNYAEETQFLARYVICSTIDEIISFSKTAEPGYWDQSNLLRTMAQEGDSDNRFFQILTKLTTDPTQHIDMLEMIYLCFSFGYQGTYRFQPTDQEDLYKIVDNLYRMIRDRRGDVAHELLIQDKKPRTLNKRKRRAISPWKTLGIVTLATAITLLGFGFILYGSTQTVTSEISRIMQGP